MCNIYCSCWYNIRRTFQRVQLSILAFNVQYMHIVCKHISLLLAIKNHSVHRTSYDFLIHDVYKNSMCVVISLLAKPVTFNKQHIIIL